MLFVGFEDLVIFMVIFVEMSVLMIFLMDFLFLRWIILVFCIIILVFMSESDVVYLL